jgi:hypothetical protein
LSNDLPGSERYLTYDGKLDIDKVSAASDGLVVIPEGRVESPTLVEARDIVRNSMGVAFLGFGFDQVNVERLSTEQAFRPSIQRPEAVYTRSIIGTAIGMTKSEIQRACSAMNKGNQSRGVSPDSFYDMTCTALLRHSLFLD